MARKAAAPEIGALRRLTLACGVQIAHRGADGRRAVASPAALSGVLDALGVAWRGEDLDRLATAVRARRAAVVLPPVVVHRPGTPPARLVWPAGRSMRGCWLVVRDEAGGEVRRRLGEVVRRQCDAYCLEAGSLGLGIGYYQLVIEGPGVAYDSLLVSAPARQARQSRRWGLFQALYGLRGEQDWGTGSYGELAELTTAAARRGADLVATLPLFALFAEGEADPSPYRPVSRLAFNELYIDVAALEEVTGSDEGARRLASPEVLAEIARLRAQAAVDYPGVIALKRPFIDIGARTLFASRSRRAALCAYLDAHPAIEPYARFRAAHEDAVGEGASRGEAAVRYHLFAQFAADRQLSAAGENGIGQAGLLLDLPVGVRPDGFDPAHAPQAFITGASCGAPPDPFAPDGQDWALRPLHPDGIREQRYRYLIACFRAVLAYGAALRVDHVMAMERIYVVPDGFPPSEGAYVRYAHEEIRAIALLEASRAGATLIGEDLGTVGDLTRRALAHDGTLRSFVYQFRATQTDPLPRPPRPAMASIGTHDLPRWSTFYSGRDVDDLEVRHMITKGRAARLRRDRARLVRALSRGSRPEAAEDDDPVWAALVKVLLHLAESRAELVLVDTGDLDLDPEPENRPGGGPTAPWHHRGASPPEALMSAGRVAALLAAIDRRRSSHSERKVHSR